MAEALWRKLTKCVEGESQTSVHLCDYPVAQEQVIDEVLGKRMTLLREIASLGRAARMDAKIKVRQPLASVEVVLVEATHQGWLEEHDEILREELNVKTIGYSCGASPYIEYQVQPNFRMLGPKLGPLLPKVKQALAGANGAQLLAELNENASIRLKLDSQEVVLDGQDIQVRLQAKPGWAAAQGRTCVVILATELSRELVLEGIARDLIRIVQDVRKNQRCNFTDRIRIVIKTEDSSTLEAIEAFGANILSETLGLKIDPATAADASLVWNKVEVNDIQIEVAIVVMAG